LENKEKELILKVLNCIFSNTYSNLVKDVIYFWMRYVMPIRVA